MSGPLLVDGNWTVVVNGSPTSVTKPVDMSKSPVAIANPFSRPGGVRAPPLFAIRSVGAGRVALVNQWQQFSIGSGTRFIFNREVLDRGLNGKPGDFGRLLQNTYRWLAEPSLGSGAPGGYTTPADRLDPPNARESVKKDFRETKVGYDPARLDTVEIPAQKKLYRGLIGAKSALSSGTGTVAGFAAAARKAGLDFLVFMEDFDRLTPAKFEQLKADCKTNSDDKLLLLAGFNIVNNIDNHMFFFGPDPVWPSDLVLTGQKKNILYIAEEDGKGGFTGNFTPFLDWVLGAYYLNKGQVGYYDFSESPRGMRMPDLRLYAMAATRYYRNGKLVEDMTDQYLTTAQCTIPPTPVSVNEVTSPQQLIAEAGSGRALTYAQAESLERSAPTGVFMGALRWTNQFDCLPVFNSDGPKVLAWPSCFRVATYGGEEFVTSKNVMLSPLLVTSDKGLKSISLYDGRALFRRFLCRGAKRFSQALVLDGSIQRDLVLIAEDVTGGKAVTFARRCWKDGALAPLFTSDHVNDGGMKLAHGPYWYPFAATPALSSNVAGYTWDGGPPAALPYVRYQNTAPVLDSDQGKQDANRLDQWPALEFSDEGAVAVQTQRNEQYDDRVAQVINSWRTYGPIDGPAKLFTITQRYREWVAPTMGCGDTSWAGIGERVGVSPTILSNTLRFQTTIKPRSLLAGFIPLKANTTLAVSTPEGIRSIESGSGHPTIPLKHGAWFGFVGKGLGNAQLFFNRGPDLTLVLTAGLELRGNLEGVEFKRGDTYTTEIAGFGFPLDVPVHTPEGLKKYADYLAQPAGMQILRGKRADSPGVLELTPSDSAVELSIPRPASRLSLTVPLLVRGLNTRWSVGLFQKAGYSKGFYGPGTNRYRPVGLDFDGNAYIPLYVDWADLTHVKVGHPIVADGSGKDLFIQVTKVADGPDRWHVSVNNPTDKEVTTTLRKAMDLPGFAFAEMRITFQPGEYRVIE
jgi:hypothetical protein